MEENKDIIIESDKEYPFRNPINFIFAYGNLLFSCVGGTISLALLIFGTIKLFSPGESGDFLKHFWEVFKFFGAIPFTLLMTIVPFRSSQFYLKGSIYITKSSIKKTFFPFTISMKSVEGIYFAKESEPHFSSLFPTLALLFPPPLHWIIFIGKGWGLFNFIPLAVPKIEDREQFVSEIKNRLDIKYIKTLKEPFAHAFLPLMIRPVPQLILLIILIMIIIKLFS
ncbi:MAG: hypothetical protein M1269_05855 [Chloroflexi bacterium]|nr:hypothetical protein [Chloroflexota bacterium]